MNNYNSIPNKYIRFIVTLILFAPVLSYITLGIFEVDFLTLTITFSLVGIVILVLFRSEKRPIIFPRYLLFLLLFIIYTTVMNYGILGKQFAIKYFFADKIVGTFYVFFLVENFKISNKYFRFVIKYSKPILIAAILVIIIQQGYKDSFLVNKYYQQKWGTIGADESRLPSIYSYLGEGMATGFGFVPIFIIVVEYLDRKKKVIYPWILGGLIFAFLTKYRWIMINALLVLIILIINHKNKVVQVVKYGVLAFILLFLSAFVLKSIGVDANKIVQERILESDTKKDKTSYSTRLLAIQTFNKMFWDHPIFGVGNIKYGIGGTGKQEYKLVKALGGHSSQLHIGYLSLFYYYGVIGGLLYLLFMYLLIYDKLYKNAKKTGMYGPFFGMLCFALANLTLVTFSLLEVGLVLSLLVDKYYMKEYKRQLKLKTIAS